MSSADDLAEIDRLERCAAEYRTGAMASEYRTRAAEMRKRLEPRTSIAPPVDRTIAAMHTIGEGYAQGLDVRPYLHGAPAPAAAPPEMVPLDMSDVGPNGNVGLRGSNCRKHKYGDDGACVTCGSKRLRAKRRTRAEIAQQKSGGGVTALNLDETLAAHDAWHDSPIRNAADDRYLHGESEPQPEAADGAAPVRAAEGATEPLEGAAVAASNPSTEAACPEAPGLDAARDGARDGPSCGGAGPIPATALADGAQTAPATVTLQLKTWADMPDAILRSYTDTPGTPPGSGPASVQEAAQAPLSLSRSSLSLVPLSLSEAGGPPAASCADSAPPASLSRPLPLLTTSRLKTFRRCPREHHYAYELGVRPIDSGDAVRFGDLIHKGLEAWFKAVADDRLRAALAALDVESGNAGTDPFDLARARVLITGYDARWSEEPYEILAVEAEFVAPLVNPDGGAKSKTFNRAGKIDVILRDLRDGRVFVMDHKTSSEDVSAGSDYWRRTRLDSQVGAYYIGAESLGHEVSGWIHDVLAKPGIRPRKATPPESRKYTKAGTLYAGQHEHDETPDEYAARLTSAIAEAPDKFFVRGEVVRLDGELLEYERDTWMQATILRDMRREWLAPRNPDACIRFGATCPYFACCTGEASIDDETRYRKVRWAHPELPGSECSVTPKEKEQ